MGLEKWGAFIGGKHWYLAIGYTPSKIWILTQENYNRGEPTLNSELAYVKSLFPKFISYNFKEVIFLKD